VNEQLLAAMTQPAPPIGTLAPTVPIPVVEVVDKALAFDKTDRWGDARKMQRAIREAYKAVAGDRPAAVRLSFEDDAGVLAHADTISASSKVPTSLTAAHDSAVFGSTRRPKRRSRLGWLVTLSALGAAGYFYLTRSSVDLPASLQLQMDGGVLGGPINIPSALARIEQALPNSPPVAESALPGRTEGPPVIDPANPAPSTALPNAAAPSSAAPNNDTPAPADSTESAPEAPVAAPSPPTVTAASTPNPQPRAQPEPKSPARKPAPPPKKHTHHRRRP
jgi:serine/threonine-protein kinase